jgi:metallophosphoesterase (TIGR03767 family)
MTGPLAVRTELGGDASTDAGDCLVSLLHISDMHVLDAASPARAEWVELLGDDPQWRPLLHVHRPYDAVAVHALDAHVRAVAATPVGGRGRPFDLVVSSGDNIDNAQRNELDAYLAIVGGGTAALDPRGSAQDPTATDLGTPWPYWSPDGSVADAWRPLGYPVIDGFLERVGAPIRSAGFGRPWTSVPGNHDLLRQGTALSTPAIEAIAVGPRKSLSRPEGFTPADVLSAYLEGPEEFARGATYPVEANPDRRAISRSEWIAAHAAAGALGYSESMSRLDTFIELEHARIVLLDTNHPLGDYQGSVGVEQLDWLDSVLASVERDRVAVLVSHHGADSLVNDRGHDPSRRLGAALTDVAHRHPCVVAWLAGHRHVNRIEPRPGPGGGFWEITTCSTIDWPSQTRSVDVVRRGDGAIEVVCEMRDRTDAPDGLGSLHRELARRFATTGVATRLTGRPIDADVRLIVPR